MKGRGRLVWVLLLCVLLPLRGALAAAMACATLAAPLPAVEAVIEAAGHPMTAPEHSEARASAPPSPHDDCPHGAVLPPTASGLGAAAQAGDAGDAGDADVAAAGLPHDGSPHHASCQLCVAGCLWLPLPTDAHDWRPEPVASGARFPAPALPVLAWVPDGLERPPKG
jgi:hypothetical protein